MKKIFILIALVMFLLSGCSDGVQKDKNVSSEIEVQPLEDEVCNDDGSIDSLICELTKAENSLPAQIRIHKEIQKYYSNNVLQVSDSMKIILNRKCSDGVRSYLLGILRSNSDNNLEGEISDYDLELSKILLDSDESVGIKARVGDQIPRALLYHSEDAPIFYSAAEKLLFEGNDTLAYIGVNTISGAFANINMNRSINTLSKFAENYKENYKERPETTIYVLLIFESMKISDFDEGIDYVCEGFNKREMTEGPNYKHRLCYAHSENISLT